MDFIIDEKTFKGHDKYLTIMQLIADPSIDVSTNTDFRKAYSGYYFPTPIAQSFKDLYFALMQRCRFECLSYYAVLEDLYNLSGCVHYSFASKLLHTVNANNPVLDRHIMRFMGYELIPPQSIQSSHPDYQNKKRDDAVKRMQYYSEAFHTISLEYEKFKNAPFMIEAIERFDAFSEEYRSISYAKKVDMMLFRLREGRSISILDYLEATH